MELYIGGYAQGKLQYVLENRGAGLPVVEEPDRLEKYNAQEAVIFHSFHEWFFEEIKKGKSPEEKMEELLLCHDGLIVISNEVGGGIVPADPVEREYRERLGRYLCRLAARSERVERIICGIGQRLK